VLQFLDLIKTARLSKDDKKILIIKLNKAVSLIFEKHNSKCTREYYLNSYLE